MFRSLVTLLALSWMLSSCNQQPAVLIFSKTKGYRHESIDSGKLAIMNLGAQKGYRVDTTESAEAFTEENLKKYHAVVFLSTTADVLNLQQQADFMRFIQAGGGYLGIHAAADTEYDWWWYGKLVGAYFKSHPAQQEAVMKKVNDFPGDKEGKLKPEWKRWDEWYNYKKISPDIKVLYNLEESTYKGGENGTDHPIMWYHDYDGGRSFYIGFGHTNQSYKDADFMNAVELGLDYAVGPAKLNYKKSTSKRAPEENRFSKVVLKYFLDEPTEMTILPDGKIIFIERKGGVKLYDPTTDSIKLINTFNVWSKSEDGMIGLTRDPNFNENNWLYVFYSHPERSANVLSRFEFRDGKIDMSTEKQMLDVVVQRQTCCHTGGSLTFDPDGNLFISTGDNTNPFESDGYSPSDDRPGRAPFDARGSSSNTNDLRGKILRIHPEPDGTYSIPEGNLFAKGEPKTRPEIYTMGLRNPYRISFDSRRKYLYWGEVGPDAGTDSETRGPRGYDEMNLAKGPGYFGWPLFIGNNYAYANYDFDKKIVSPGQDPKAPKNLSANNTGKVDLPALSDPFIYYPYAESPDFPLMRTGGRNAMAGPVFYSEDYKGQSNAFPDYFNGKLIIYEWMRGWMRLVSLDDNGKITDIEPFMDKTTFNNPIDMEFGPDGRLYVLEYGTKWFGHNEDARLCRIDWNPNNRVPIAKFSANKTSGAVPLQVEFSADGSEDPDAGALTYNLSIDGKDLSSADGKFSYSFTKPGVYRPLLKITDPEGTSSTAELVIIAGNAMPQISISVQGNDTYFFAGKTGKYKVSVSDAEDGSTDDGTIPSEKVSVSASFVAQGFDKTLAAQGHQQPNHPGELLIAESDCKSCHMIDQKSAGPSYLEVAKKYEKDPSAIDRLSDKIIKGGSGVWGEVAMAAHPQISKENASQMASYILSLAREKKGQMKIAGDLKFENADANPMNTRGVYLISARYSDKGKDGLPSLTVSGEKVLKSPYLTAMDNVIMSPGMRADSDNRGGKIFNNVFDGSFVTFKDVDLRQINSITSRVVHIGESSPGGNAEILLGGPDGKKLGTANLLSAPGIPIQAGISMRSATVGLSGLPDRGDITIVFKNPAVEKDKNLFIFVHAGLGAK